MVIRKSKLSCSHPSSTNMALIYSSVLFMVYSGSCKACCSFHFAVLCTPLCKCIASKYLYLAEVTMYSRPLKTDSCTFSAAVGLFCELLKQLLLNPHKSLAQVVKPLLDRDLKKKKDQINLTPSEFTPRRNDITLNTEGKSTLNTESQPGNLPNT